MTTPTDTPKMDRGQPWPDTPEVATVAAMMYMQLGGQFIIHQDGGRSIGRWHPTRHGMMASGAFQLPDPDATERLESPEELRGAAKLLEYVLCRLSPADKELVFSTFGTEEGIAQPFDFREHMQ